MTKAFSVTLTFLILIITTVAFTTRDQPHWKNLKVLPQDISKEKLDSVMHNFCQSLSVRCNFCHLRDEASKQWDFATDTVADKLIARQMMLMTRDINKKYFMSFAEAPKPGADLVQPVGCYTCHRGSALPAVLPPPPPPRNPEVVPPGNK